MAEGLDAERCFAVRPEQGRRVALIGFGGAWGDDDLATSVGREVEDARGIAESLLERNGMGGRSGVGGEGPYRM